MRLPSGANVPSFLQENNLSVNTQSEMQRGNNSHAGFHKLEIAPRQKKLIMAQANRAEFMACLTNFHFATLRTLSGRSEKFSIFLLPRE